MGFFIIHELRRAISLPCRVSGRWGGTKATQGE